VPAQRAAQPDGQHAGEIDAPPGPRPQVPVQSRQPLPARWDVLLSHRDRLLVLAHKHGCTRDDAHDIVQEALLRTACQSDLDHDRAGAFLTTTVRRLVIDGHRHQQRQHRLADHAALHPQPAPSHEDAVCDRAEGAWLQQQTARLRPRERTALLARASGRTAVETAAELDVTVKAVEMLTRRGRLALQALLITACALACLTLGVPGVQDTGWLAPGNTTDTVVDRAAPTGVTRHRSVSTSRTTTPRARHRGRTRGDAAAASASPGLYLG